MGSVYLAEQLDMNRDVVIKVILPQLSHRPDVAGRFRREARSLAKLRHPNIVRVLSTGELPDGALYLAMEYVPGKTLDRAAAAGESLGEVRLRHLATQMTAGLAAAHEAGIIHRDLKPQNVMICDHTGKPDHVVLLDFGLAKLLGPGEGQSLISQTGAILGTPAYMSPEQIEGQPVDARSDIYSLGVIMCELATGTNPFAGNTPMQCFMKHLKAAVPPLRSLAPDRGLSADFESIVARCLHKDVASRFSSAVELLEALEGSTSSTGPLADTLDPGLTVTTPAPNTGEDDTLLHTPDVGRDEPPLGTPDAGRDEPPPPTTIPSASKAGRAADPQRPASFRTLVGAVFVVVALGVAFALQYDLTPNSEGDEGTDTPEQTNGVTTIAPGITVSGEVNIQGVNFGHAETLDVASLVPYRHEPYIFLTHFGGGEHPGPLGAKIDRYIDACLNPMLLAGTRARDAYLDWADPDSGPPHDREQYFMWDLSPADACLQAVELESPEGLLTDALDRAADTYADTLAPLSEVLSEGNRYYDLRLYQDDDFARGHVLHDAFMAALIPYEASLRALLDEVMLLHGQALAIQLEHSADSPQIVLYELARLATELDGIIDVRPQEIDQIAEGRLADAIRAYALVLDQLSEAVEENGPFVRSWRLYDWQLNDARYLLAAAREVQERRRAERPFDQSELRRLSTSSTKNVFGSPGKVRHHYNNLVIRLNGLRPI